MRELVITRFELATAAAGGYGGLTGRGWHSHVRAALEDNGFDLARTVEIHRNYSTASYTYRQKESSDGRTQTTT